MKRGLSRWEIAFAVLVVAAGFVLRLRLAATTYLNPDEALHALFSIGTWREVLRHSLMVTHPPLLILINHLIVPFSRAELAARMVPLLAGSAFPVVLALWVRRVAGTMTAGVVLLLLMLSPALIAISAVVRSYTLAFLFLSLSLLVFEEAIAAASAWKMALYTVLLYGAILSDYSMAWFAGAAGIYALMRLPGLPARVKTVWTMGQAVALAIYAVLFRLQVPKLRVTSGTQAVNGWLMGAFPHRQNAFIFPFYNTPKLFAFVMSSIFLGAALMALFAAGVYLLWMRETRIEPRRARALAVLLVVPFGLGLAGAYAHLFPYGRSRHDLVLGIFGVVGAAIVIETLPRRAALASLAAALLLSPLWIRRYETALYEIPRDRAAKELIPQCLEYMRSAIPPGAPVFTEIETLWILKYYAGDLAPANMPTPGFLEYRLDGRWRAVTSGYQYENLRDFKKALADFRREYRIAEQDPVWILDGGWGQSWIAPGEARPFAKAIQVVETR
ncbi:MAG: glycosyltransferase family 39 protein [Acidobacteriia bacterium]|nr:glycosyltransferase family 39 protein [Terriglobia bacterium]